ncbi:MAG: hypothetical protein K0R39_3948 [Symbiobacteriaceae bacterium]|jgi:4-hydroxybenzoate polyprenyltransferase|nr:hypothetical protein [Symbiobacteriaceae bacterium]
MKMIWRQLGRERARILLLLCALTLAGAALSPDFLSPAFPSPGMTGTALVQWAAARVPWLFSPPVWSLWHALVTVLLVAFLWLGASYAYPSLRPRRSGPGASLANGAGVTLAMTAGLMGQTGVTEVGLLAATALGVLAAVTTLIGDFIYMDEDRAAGRLTLPLIVGTRTAVLINIAAVAAAYLLALFLLLQRIGMQERVLALFGLPVGAHLQVLRQLGQDPGPAQARKASRLVLIIFLVMTLLYVAAQAACV